MAYVYPHPIDLNEKLRVLREALVRQSIAVLAGDLKKAAELNQEMRDVVDLPLTCVCEKGNPCLHHAATCTTCTPSCLGHPGSPLGGPGTQQMCKLK